MEFGLESHDFVRSDVKGIFIVNGVKKKRNNFNLNAVCNLVKIKGADENTYILSFIFCIYKLSVVIQIQWNISFKFGTPLVNGHLHSKGGISYIP